MTSPGPGFPSVLLICTHRVSRFVTSHHQLAVRKNVKQGRSFGLRNLQLIITYLIYNLNKTGSPSAPQEPKFFLHLQICIVY